MRLKTRKKLMLVAAVVILLNFSNCKKYDDGPLFSLLTKKMRLTTDWEVQEIDGVDVDTELILEFEKDGDFSLTETYSYYGYSYTDIYLGEWEWEDGKESIEIDLDDGYNMEWEVKRLTSSEFWFEDEDGIEWECEKQ